MPRKTKTLTLAHKGYDSMLGDVARLIEEARRASARTVNSIMTATYWAIGQKIVEHEQGGAGRAAYGAEIIDRLSADLTDRVGRGFGRRNLFQMRAFYLAYREIVQTVTAQSRDPQGGKKVQTSSALSSLLLTEIAPKFPLPWSHYVRLLSVENHHARSFYEAEALRGGWTRCTST